VQAFTMARDTNFYFSFLTLPRARRAAIVAVWDFCRAVDDEVDEDESRSPADRRAGLQRWRQEVAACFGDGTPVTAQGRALAPHVAAYRLPRLPFDQLIDGCEMDIGPVRFSTFCDLRGYCYRVASTVGLICIEIFGYENPATRQYAEQLGLALQLTNILRDVRSDLARGRLYIPLDELAAHGVVEDDLRRGDRTPAVRALLERQANRARDQFSRADAALPAEDARALVAARIMGAIYRDLLDRIVARDYDVFSSRVRVSTPRKAWIALRIWLRALAGPHNPHVLRPAK
jgi:phytoene synthase